MLMRLWARLETSVDWVQTYRCIGCIGCTGAPCPVSEFGCSPSVYRVQHPVGGYLEPGIGVSDAIAIGATDASTSVEQVQMLGVSGAARFRQGLSQWHKPHLASRLTS